MGRLIHYNLGFFDVDLVAGEFGDRIECLRVAPGPDTARFDRLVEELFGDLPTRPKGSSESVYRDDCGMFTVSLWNIDKQTELANAIMQLQEETACSVFRLCQGIPSFADRQSLVEDLQYFVHEYWEKFRAEHPEAFPFAPDKNKHSKSTRETGHRRRNAKD